MQLDESFIVALVSVTFIALVFKRAKSFIVTTIEQRIQNIRHKFDEVLAINEESKKILTEYQALHKSSEQVVKDILISAESEVAQLKAQAEKEIDLQLKNKDTNIANKIHNDELKLLSELRLNAVNLAISSSITILNSHNKNKPQEQLIKEAIDTISVNFKENTSYLI